MYYFDEALFFSKFFVLNPKIQSPKPAEFLHKKLKIYPKIILHYPR